jgi:ParB family chromosome partitioning protein
MFELRELPLARIDAPKRPARRFMGDIDALADSMQEYGLQQPISVRAQGDRFVLTSGLRRLTAARLLGWESIPAFVRTVSADQAYVLDLIENLQRQDLTPEEEADALGELIRTRGWTLQQIADAVKRSVSYVSKRVRVFEDPLLRAAVADRGLAVSTAEELLGAEPEQRPALIERAVAERWDQVRAREAIRTAERAVEPNPDQPEDAKRRPVVARTESISADRPTGFTRAIREFHRLIVNVRAQDLTSADRAALRSLFRDLVMLARAPAERRAPVIPPLPTAPQLRRSGARSRTRASSIAGRA